MKQVKLVWIFAVLFSTTLVWLLPITSDLFNYLAHAHLLTDLGANPLLESAFEVNQAVLAKTGSPDPLLSAYMNAYASTPSIYGPAWALVSAPATLASSRVAFGLFYLKGLACFAFLACAWLVMAIVERLRPSSAVEALYLFSWNPLVLLMAVGDGHNDVVMMAGVLLGFWFLLKDSWAAAFGALALSACIKYVGALFIPCFVMYGWVRSRYLGQDRQGPVLLRGGLAAVVMTGLVFVPLGSLEWITSVHNRLLRPANWAWDLGSRQGAGSEWMIAQLGLVSHGLLAGLPTLVLAGGLAVFVLSYLFLTSRLALGLTGGVFMRKQPGEAEQTQLSWQHDNTQRLLDTGFSISLLIFVLGVARSQPWHLLWPASLAGLSAKRGAWVPVIALSAILLLSQIWIEWGTPDFATLLSEVI
jgi:hypothetical protein